MVPSFFFGKYREVKTRTANAAQRILSGKTFAEANIVNGVIYTGTSNVGSFALKTLNDISSVRLDFHCTLLKALLADGCLPGDDPVGDALFLELIKHDWGCLVFADQKDLWFNKSVFSDASYRWKPYISSVLKFASSYTAEKKRFVDMNGNITDFWHANSALHYILMQSGISGDQAKDHLDEPSFRAICRKLEIA